MISLDRDAPTPLHEQLVEQLRYQIAVGRFKTGDTLPSTRALGEQLNLSFHTVRKAYQQLEAEGLLQARKGSGYTVVERTPLSKTERMERGAAIVQEALQRLIGLGLDDAEIEYLFAEQRDLLEDDGERLKLVVVASYRELADEVAAQIGLAMQQTVEAATFEDLERHRDADYVFTRLQDVRRASEAVPRADVLGLRVQPALPALARVARMLETETLGLVTRYPDAIGPLSGEIREQTGFSGQILGASVERGAAHVEPLLAQTDLVLYTPACHRRLLGYLDKVPCEMLSFRIDADALEQIRHAIPT